MSIGDCGLDTIDTRRIGWVIDIPKCVDRPHKASTIRRRVADSTRLPVPPSRSGHAETMCADQEDKTVERAQAHTVRCGGDDVRAVTEALDKSCTGPTAPTCGPGRPTPHDKTTAELQPPSYRPQT